MASRAKPNAPDLFENGEDFPTPLHSRRKRLGGWKLFATTAVALVGVLVERRTRCRLDCPKPPIEVGDGGIARCSGSDFAHDRGN